MYPAISAEVLDFFLCVQINGIWYLVNDFSLNCYDSSWNKYLGLNIFLVFLYPVGIPCFMFYMLYRNRRRLRDPATLQSLGFLYEAYHLKQWWFELVDMLNKFFLTSVLAFFPINAQMPVGMVWVNMYTTVVLFTKPYVRLYDDRLQLYANIHLFLIMLMALTLQSNPFTPGSSTDVFASVLLLIVLGLLLVCLLFNSYVFFRKFIRNRQRIHKIKNEEHLVENPMQLYPEFHRPSQSKLPLENVEMTNPLSYMGASSPSNDYVGTSSPSNDTPATPSKVNQNEGQQERIKEAIERRYHHTFNKMAATPAANPLSEPKPSNYKFDENNPPPMLSSAKDAPKQKEGDGEEETGDDDIVMVDPRTQ